MKPIYISPPPCGKSWIGMMCYIEKVKRLSEETGRPLLSAPSSVTRRSRSASWRVSESVTRRVSRQNPGMKKEVDVKVHLLEVVVIDDDGMGVEQVAHTLENTRYPNRCISPRVTAFRTEDMGEWRDDHPLNTANGQVFGDAVERLFGDTLKTVWVWHLRKQRFSLANALGYDTANEDLVPLHKQLVKEVKGLVEMRKQLNVLRRFLREET